MKYNEFQVAQKFEAESATITKEEIVEFALKYDPQYMHIDEKKARESRFGSIIASGMHTLSVTWNSWVQLGLFGDDVIAGVSIQKVKFHRPVFAEDCLSVKIEIIDMEQRKPDCGAITLYLSTYNQNNDLVLEAEVTGLIQV
ncbi:MaoC family dehydratase N-terminal domain-containing protein [Sporosarcina sp. Marseille-Q4063]|uniref:MaoC/PaaZ C-terminal domain-containing protein n=1 Tax=Sporosarcina sp. Marseille-Q4063 TaxID=2810514 RepID=UPI001BB03E17|nr:MaoC/PaaZ C-terminal domain-containing protein [Sporosarcina sp. Marseille-Q4063]QUW21386.1 MaoC family dehydratase N-terminal domain-containing protein [Sporosarcina sp. Marseille-Q4063]